MGGGYFNSWGKLKILIKERQGFSSEMSFYPDNNLDEIELTLLEGPSGLKLMKSLKMYLLAVVLHQQEALVIQCYLAWGRG